MTGTIMLKKSPNLAVEVPATFIDAPCRGDNEALFYSYNRETDATRRAYRQRLARARTICSTCPLHSACRREAQVLPRPLQFGIWAGRDMHLEPNETYAAKRYRHRNPGFF